MAIALWDYAGAFVIGKCDCWLSAASYTAADTLRGSLAGLTPSYALGRIMLVTARCKDAAGGIEGKEAGNSTIAIPGHYCLE